MPRRGGEGETVSVLEYFTALLAEKELRDQQRFDGSNIAINAALLAAEKAVTKAETAADKRFELLNELRVGVATKEQVEALEKRLNEMAARLDRAEGRSGGFSGAWVALVGAVGMVVAVATLWAARK